MYRGMSASGAILTIFGIFLIVLDLYVPMGVSVFGLAILIVGVLMFVGGFLRAEPEPVTASPGMKFCWYCMSEIPKDSTECPSCSLPQHELND
jgi:hypothetical protein